MIGTLLSLIGLSLPFIIVIGVIIGMGLRIVQQFERGVVFRLGKLNGIKTEGLNFIIPVLDRMQKVDLRVVALDIPSQEAITRDNVTVKVNAVVYYQVVDPARSIINVEDFRRATWQIAQTSLRNVIGQSLLDDLLSEREKINARLQQIIDEATENWGVKVSMVEIKDAELPDNMKRAMAKQAEAERERRAKVIHAEGEAQASVRLADAATTMASAPGAIQLRYLQTLTEIAVEQNSTIVFPMPLELMDLLMNKGRALVSKPGGGDAAAPAAPVAPVTTSEGPS